MSPSTREAQTDSNAQWRILRRIIQLNDRPALGLAEEGHSRIGSAFFVFSSRKCFLFSFSSEEDAHAISFLSPQDLFEGKFVFAQRRRAIDGLIECLLVRD